MIPPTERSGSGQPPPPEKPGKYPLDVQIVQPDLIYEQVVQHRKSITPSTQSWEKGSIIGILHGKEEMKTDVFDGVGIRLGVSDPTPDSTDQGFFEANIFLFSHSQLSRKQGEKITEDLRKLGYYDAQYITGNSFKNQTLLKEDEKDYTGGITLTANGTPVEIDLGSNDYEQYRTRTIKLYEEKLGAVMDDKNNEKIYRIILDELYARKEQSTRFQARFNPTNAPLTHSTPLTPENVEQALKTSGKLCQELHFLINDVKGVSPSPKVLVLKPEALNTDVRQATEIAKTNAPISREMALPREVTFEQIAGYENEVANLQDIAFMLKEKDPHAPKGILLYGPPGTGKTTMAKAFAAECRDFATFTPIEMGGIFTSYIHESANKLKRFLEDAQKKTYDAGKSTAIVFLDELEAVATTIEDARAGAGVDDRKEVRKVLLEWLDGIRNIKNPWDSVPVFMIGATNFKETIDEALTRSGRMEEHIYMGEPSPDGLGKIMQLKASEVDFVDPNINWSELSHKMHGASGADVESLLRRAYRIAVTRAKRTGGEPRKVTEADIISVLPQIEAARKRKKEEIEIKKGQLGFQTGK